MTSVQEIYERNLHRQYTQADAKQFDEAERQLAANRLDVKGPGAQRNQDLIDEFFQKNRSIPVTVQNIYKAVEQRKNEFVWLSPAEAEWYQTAQKNLALANQLATLLATQGRRPGQLVNDGDQLFENLTLLFTEIQSRRESATQHTISGAEDRILHRPGRQLHRVAQPRRTEPVSAAAKADDGTPFLGRDLVKNADGTLRSKTPAEQRRDAEAAERAKSQTHTPALDASEQAWKNLTDQLLHDGTHSQQARVRAVYDREQGSGWRKIYEACKREVNLTKNRSVR